MVTEKGLWALQIALIYCLFTLTTDAKSLQIEDKSDTPLHPVILVPGDGGSQFEAKLDKPSVAHYYCQKKTDYWYSLWLNIELLAPYVLECTVDNLRLVYDNETRSTSNSPGVQIRVPGFGNTTTVEWLSPSQFGPTSYFHKIADGLVSLGYTRNVNIRGAPYDFRKAPNEMGPFFDDLVKLVEETYASNNNTRVILMGHSMGCPMTLYMLNQQTQKWKDKYIQSFIALSGPWGGATKTLRLMASGDNLGVFVVNPLSARVEQRSMPSSAWLLPYQDYWKEDDIFVYAPHRNYTIKDYKQFFQDINFMNGYSMREDTYPLGLNDLKPPGVEVFCMHGYNVSTPERFIYSNSSWYSSQPDVISGDGDGTVNLVSAQGCLRWDGKQQHPVHYKTFKKVDHMGILSNADVVEYIKGAVTQIHRDSGIRKNKIKVSAPIRGL